MLRLLWDLSAGWCGPLFCTCRPHAHSFHGCSTDTKGCSPAHTPPEALSSASRSHIHGSFPGPTQAAGPHRRTPLFTTVSFHFLSVCFDCDPGLCCHTLLSGPPAHLTFMASAVAVHSWPPPSSTPPPQPLSLHSLRRGAGVGAGDCLLPSGQSSFSSRGSGPPLHPSIDG